MTTPEGKAPEEKKRCSCGKMPGLFIILFGYTFLLHEAGFIGSKVTGLIWPCIVVLAGAYLMFGGSCKCCKTE